MKMNVVLGSCIVLLVGLTGMPVQALEPLVLYDNFNKKFVDPDKWFVGQDCGGGCPRVRQGDSTQTSSPG